MQHKARFLLLIAVLLVAGSFCALAQAPAPALGDYGSVVTGMWDTVSTWKMYSTNGAFDSAATAAPSSSRNVYILTGTTVTYQTASQNCKNLVIQTGGQLQGTGTLPTAALYLKINGSTVWVDGKLGSGPTDPLSLETKYSGTIKLAGAGTVSIGQVRPNSGQSGTMTFEFAMNANINYNGSSGQGGAGIYTSRGTQTLSTITIDSGVTVTFAPGSHFELTSSSSNLGFMNTVLNVYGTLDAPASSLLLADSAAYTAALNIGSHGVVNVGKDFKPYLTGGGVASLNLAEGGKLNILNGGTADFTEPTSKVVGGGAFALQGGATIKVGAAAGLDSAAGPVQTATAFFDTAANYSYLGTGVQSFGKLLPDSVNNLTIGANSIDTVLAVMHDTVALPRKVKGVLQIDGLLVNNGWLTTVDTAIVNGTYQHNTTLGAMPTAIWNTGSLCLVTAPVTTGSTGMVNGNQNFYNFTVDAPAHTGAGRLGFDGNTINGNLVIHNSNDSFVGTGNYIAIAPKTGSLPVTVMGDLLIDSLAAQLSIGTGSGVAKQTLDVHGNVFSKGRLYLNGSGVSNQLIVHGNLIIQSVETDAFRGHSALDPKADTVWFAGSGAEQRFVKPTAIDMDNIQFVVLPGATVSLEDSMIVNDSGSNPGTFRLDSAATLISAHANGLDGNIQSTGGAFLSKEATYEFRGTSAQVTGTKLPSTVKSLVINDSLGVTLSKADTMSVLVLQKGRLVTDTNFVVPSTVTRTSGYVDGGLWLPFDSTGAKTFDVGTEKGYTPVTVTVTQGSGKMLVRSVKGYHPQTFDTTKTLSEYWTLAADTTIKKVDLKFAYLPADIHGNEVKYGVYRYTGTGTTWTPLTTVNWNAQDFVLTTGVTSFSDFTLGESNDVTKVENAPNSLIPDKFYVDQNYPNPFNPSTTISYGLPRDAFVTLKVYNLVGQEVASVLAQDQRAGVHTVSFDGSHLSSGVYFYRIQAGSFTEVKRMLLLK